MSDIRDAAPRHVAMTLDEFNKRRGYDPVTRTYAPEDTPDLSGTFFHAVRSTTTD